MGKFIDLTGHKYNRLTVIERCGRSSDGHIAWLCRCDCGNTTVVAGKSVRRGDVKSCGCLSSETTAARNYRHGLRHTKLYAIWLNMKNRCNNPHDEFYHCYGERGIKVCEEWSNDFKSFYDWSMSNGYTEKLTIDRIDVNKGYSPDNCRWASLKVQANNKTNNHYITYNGKTQSMMDWAEELGMKYTTLRSRINSYKWDIEKAFNEPVREVKR